MIKNMLKKISFLVFTTIPFALITSAQLTPAGALNKVCAKGGSNCNGTAGQTQGFTVESVFQLILSFAAILTYFAVGLAVLALVYGGVLMISDSGDQARVGKGKKIVTNAVIGLVIAIVAATIVNIVGGLAGANISGVINGTGR
jgi:hypothetical protein